MRSTFRRSMLCAAVLLAAVGSGSALATAAQKPTPATKPSVVVHKDPNCGCCSLWGKHMEQAGFAVTYVDEADMPAVRTKLRVPRSLQSCHTAVVGGFVVEGHVPAADVKRLLATRPSVAGIAVPGMPVGSPGMEVGDRRQSYAVMSFDKAGKTAVFAEH